MSTTEALLDPSPALTPPRTGRLERASLPDWLVRATFAAAGLAAAAGTLAAARAKGPSNTYWDMAYPLGILPFVIVLALVTRGLVLRRPDVLVLVGLVLLLPSRRPTTAVRAVG